MRKLVSSFLLSFILVVLPFASARAEILIAVAGPLTGLNTFRGEQIQRGAQRAVADINANGGVLGQKVRLIVGDDSCDPEQAVALARKLVNDGVVFVAGHVCSHSSIPASAVYHENRVLMISPASTNPKLTDGGLSSVFRVCGRDDQQGEVAARFLEQNWSDKNIAIIHDKTVYGQGLADQVRKQLHERGITETLYQAFEPGLSDYSELVEVLGVSGIIVVYFGGYTAEAGLILREAKNQGLEIKMVGGDTLTTEEFWMIAGSAGEGTMMTFSPDPRKNPESEDVVAHYRAQGFEPGGYTLHTYAAVQSWAQAVGFAGSLELQEVISALRENMFSTVLGSIGFDNKGDVKAPGFVWYVWRNGEYVVAE